MYDTSYTGSLTFFPTDDLSRPEEAPKDAQSTATTGCQYGCHNRRSIRASRRVAECMAVQSPSRRVSIPNLVVYGCQYLRPGETEVVTGRTSLLQSRRDMRS